MNITLPADVQYIIERLNVCGHAAYAVGGCVRDALMGVEPHDWDLCTSAKPERTIECFAEHRIVTTGLKHGTVTLVLNDTPFEITTFRVESDYSDRRRPDNVEFVDIIEQDLSRRDFTINAIAYHPNIGVVDPFNGAKDIRSRTVRCVGQPDRRFGEDALRIMRAARFASALDFDIDDDTAASMRRNVALLDNIAVERITAELNRLLVGVGFSRFAKTHVYLLTHIIPELAAARGFEQRNPYHNRNVLDHTLAAVSAAPRDLVVRLTMLLHDVGKPFCYTFSDGKGHFHRHARVGADMATAILTRMRYDSKTVGVVRELILHHGDPLTPDERAVKRLLNKFGVVAARRLIEVKRADTMAKSPHCHVDKLRNFEAVNAAIDRIVAQRQCFSLRDLAISGDDLLAYGIPQGEALGATLSALLDMVLDGSVANERDALLREIER